MRQLLLLRHGEAAEGSPDRDRYLTAVGIEGLNRVLKGCAARPSVLITSPYRRAHETAEIARELLSINERPIISQALTPDATPEALWDEVRTLGEDSVLVVTHQPLISHAAEWILGHATPHPFTPGALCAIAINTSGARPTSNFEWMRTPENS